MEEEPNLELTLQHRSPAEPPGFFCIYCDREFCSKQALGGHQNAHKYERSLAKHRREIAAAMPAHGPAAGAVVAASHQRVRLQAKQQDATPLPALLMSHKKMPSEPSIDSADDLDLSLRL